MSDWAHGLVAAGGVTIGMSLLLVSQFVGPEVAALLQLGAPLVFVAGFALGMAADNRSKRPTGVGSPWLALAAAVPVGGFTASVPIVVGAILMVFGLFSDPRSPGLWLGLTGALSMVVLITTSAVLLSLTTAGVAAGSAILDWRRHRADSV